MVALGDPRAPLEPFRIDCPQAGKGHWIDSRTWVYDFDRDLPAGVRCTFRLRPGLRALSGAAIGGPSEYSFSTGGPSIDWTLPGAGNERIDEEQAFVLVLDGEPDLGSVRRHAAFAIDGLPRPVGVRVLDGEERQAILDVLRDESDFENHPVIVLQARQRFPNATRVRLIWGKGIRSASGIGNAQDQVLSFVTRPEFRAYVHCGRLHTDSECLPLGKIGLYFGAPVDWSLASQVKLVLPDGTARSPDEPEESAELVYDAEFAGPFPESAKLRVEIPAEIRDDAGRSLSNEDEFPLIVPTDAFPPLVKFASRFGIVEWKADATLPVTVRNVEPEIAAARQRLTSERSFGWRARIDSLLDRITGSTARLPPEKPEQILPWLRRVAATKRDTALLAGDVDPSLPLERFELPKPGGADSLEVIGIPFQKPGLYVVELASPRLGAALLQEEAAAKQPPPTMYVRSAALVTNLSVHFKWGSESSLAWVTRLDSADPVGGALVTVHDCHGEVIARAKTDRKGIARIGALPDRRTLPNCYDSDRFDSYEAADYQDYYAEHALRSLDYGLLVVAQTHDDLSFVHTSWDDGIEGWRYQLPEQGWREPILAHTIFDRPLFRAGETVHMKHVLRAQTVAGFAVPAAADRPTVAEIRHLGTDDTYELELDWDERGLAENTWEVPRAAKLGRYTVTLKRPSPSATPTAGTASRAFPAEWASGSFRVEEFRVPLMRASLALPAEPVVQAPEVPVDIAVQYLAGGGAGNLPVVLRSQIRTDAFPAPPDFEHFTFGNGAVREGVFAVGDEEEGVDGGGEAARPKLHARQDLSLDAAGTARTAIGGLPRSDNVRELLAEIEFRDPNGEVQTVSATVPLWPAALLPGIRAEHWAGTKDALRARVAVVDSAGKAVAGANVRVDLFARRTYSNRRRLVGGFYGYENTQEVRAIGPFCSGQTDGRGELRCEAAPPADGSLVLQATVTDDAGRSSSAHGEVWVAGEDEWGFSLDAADRMDLVPEERRYEPGDTARFQVRMPFRKATALVTTEREGILDAWVEKLSGNDPVVEVPVRGEHAPNVFVSVLAVRGRVGEPPPTAMVDLAKPSFKLGIAEIRVGWQTHELDVRVSPDQTVYQVRDKARVKISVRKPDGKPPKNEAEVAIAAVDEGLLELEPNRSWNLLESVMRRRGYRIQTSTAQLQVIGKRHYGRKALPSGGGGGRQATRELFDTLLLWRARVPLDERGEAFVEVPLNDSLTAFRIVAVATAADDRFGTGSASIRSTQDLMLLSGLAPLAREGDRQTASVTLRNTTERPMQVEVRAWIEGAPEALGKRLVDVGAGEAQTLGWEVEVPAGADRLVYVFEASEAGGARDRLRVEQRVRPAVPVRTLQATITRWEKPIRQPVEMPRDALAGRGGIDVRAAATLAAGLDGVRTWMRDYPYTCLEQRVSRAVALGGDEGWTSITAELGAYVDRDGLLKYFPGMTAGSEVLTAYVVSLAHDARRELPADLETRMAEGLRRFVRGEIVRPAEVHSVDLPLRKLAAVAALARLGKAEAALLDSITLEPNWWPTSAVLDWWSILDRLPDVPRREARLAEAEQIVRARLDLRGTMLRFSTERNDRMSWLMVSPETNALRLLLHLLGTDRWHDDLPRLARAAVALQRRGAWSTTVANAWGTVALTRFVDQLESEPVTGTTSAALAGEAGAIDWSQPEDRSLPFRWPPSPAELTIDHAGSGHPWLTISSRAAIPLREPLSSGLRVTKTVTPIEPRLPDRPAAGDKLHVRLDIEAQSDMTWVVVDDPVPAGASHLGTGLARDSQIESGPAAAVDEISPTFIERSFDAFRAYYEWIPKGRFSVDYVIRLNQSGVFHLPPTRVEALYAPETFGERPNDTIEVEP